MKIKWKKWLDEFCRDILALGGVLFYFLFIGRALVAPHYDYALQLVFSILVYIFLLIFIHGGEGHVARALIAIVFSVMYYDDFGFNVFIGIAYVFLLFSVLYLKKSWVSVMKGLALGIISSIIGYFAWLLLI